MDTYLHLFLTSAYVPGFHNAIPNAIKAVVPAKVVNIFNDPNVLLSADIRKQLIAQFAKFGPQGHALYTALMDAVKVGLTSDIHNVYVLSTNLHSERQHSNGASCEKPPRNLYQ